MAATTPALQYVIVNSTNVVRLRKLRDEATHEWIDDATVTCTLYDDTDTPIAGAVDLPVDYIAGSTPSQGEYQAVLSHTLSLTVGALYTLRTTVIGSDGSHRIFTDSCQAIIG